MLTLLEGVILAGFMAAAAAPFLGKPGRAHGLGFAVLCLGLFSSILLWVPPGSSSRRPWAENLGLTLDFHVSQLGWTFALLITGIGALVFLYGGAYMEKDPEAGRFFSTLFAFMASMLGLAFADSFLLLFLFWELTSVTSFLLISHKAKLKARKSALLALFVTGAGGLALLAGLLIFSSATGSVRLSELAPISAESPLAGASLALVLLGCFTKSAQFPFHGWLPGAMEAPSPVSAYLHSATMVKAGVFLLAQVAPGFSSMPSAWLAWVGGVGAATLVLGAVFSFFATDLKRILAFSTVSSLGALTMILGFWPSAKAGKAFAAFLVAHALYKGALFMLAGLVEHETGSRDIKEVGRLGKAIPLAGVFATLAALSMMGLIPFLGFVGKEYLLGMALSAPWALGASLVGAAGGVYAAFQAGIRPWWMTAPSPSDPHEERHHSSSLDPLVLAPGVLALAGLALGAAMAWTGPSLLDPLASSLSSEGGLKLKLWAGVNLELILSLSTLAAGVLLAWSWPRWRAGAERWSTLWGPTQAWTGLLEGLATGARAAARKLEHGKVRWDFLTYFVAAFGLAGACLIFSPWAPLPPPLASFGLPEALILTGGIAAVIASFAMASRVAALALLGGLGLALAAAFMMMGAPDLAITQLLVDILVVVFLVVVLARLPRFSSISKGLTRVRDALVAGCVGSVVAFLTYLAATTPGPPSIAPWIAENSVSGAKGANVVNTILVDFRALDTLGEATVLVLAALGVFAIVRLRRGKAVGKA